MADRAPVTALVIGKFLPFHNGHEAMILEAAENWSHVHVVVYGGGYKLSGEHRKAMIEAQMEWRQVQNVSASVINTPLYDDYDDSAMWRAHNVALHTHLRSIDLTWWPPIGVVFGSEGYIYELADGIAAAAAIRTAEHGVAPVWFDVERERFPVSGTKVRFNPVGRWMDLPLSTRTMLMPRIIVVGAESTGTTTLSLHLRDKLRARWRPEFGREYTERWLRAEGGGMEQLRWDDDDFEAIARIQAQTEYEAVAMNASFANPVYVGDTDEFATGIWRRRYLGEMTGEIMTPQEQEHYSPFARLAPRLYLVTDHEGVEFEQDGIRDGEHLRAQMTEEFVTVLDRMKQNWALVTGDPKHRLHIAEHLVEPLLLQNREW